MTPDEDQGVHSEHVVEISNELTEARSARRRSFATISVAVCLALVGAVTAVAFVRDQSEDAADKQRDAVQREQLLDGWTTLGAVAAAQRAADEMRAPATQPVAPSAMPAPVQNVIIVSPTPAATSPSSSSSGAPAVIAPALMSAPAPAATTAPGVNAAPVGVPAPASAPDQTPAAIPASPPPGSPDTVLNPVTYPASQSCGLSTCNVDSVCCNVSCGICAAPGSCSQTQCG